MVQFDVKRVQKGVQSFMVSFDFSKTPITQIADYIIIAASKHNTSDIHFDPREEGMMVRFRIDGDCQDYTFIPKAYERNLTTRLKLLANMNITESRLPQDGAIKGMFGDTYLDMRVSCLPLNEGEKIVIRILDYTRSLQGIDSLGFHPDNLAKVKRMMGIPNGIILTTGATGSGKSTTTYSILQGLNKPETNVITVEDPIEMNIEGINQVQVNAEIGMTFAAALRSILRQDPNVILIGEIRDSETAQIAVRASITGHLVLSTIHTNNSLATIERLLDMNVERYLLSTALTGIISQRLAKMLCQECRYQRETTKYEKKIFKKYLHKDVATVWDANPKGCEHCRRGYHGRVAIHEVLELDDGIRVALNNEKLDKKDLAKMVYTNKTITMLQDALIKALEGKTSFEEVYRTIEIENEDDDNYEEEVEQVVEQAPVEETTIVEESDDLLDTNPKEKSEIGSMHMNFQIPELEAEKEAAALEAMEAEQEENKDQKEPAQATQPVPNQTQQTATQIVQQQIATNPTKESVLRPVTPATVATSQPTPTVTTPAQTTPTVITSQTAPAIQQITTPTPSPVTVNKIAQVVQQPTTATKESVLRPVIPTTVVASTQTPAVPLLEEKKVEPAKPLTPTTPLLDEKKEDIKPVVPTITNVNKENKPLTPTAPLLDEKKEDIKPVVPTITNVNKENKPLTPTAPLLDEKKEDIKPVVPTITNVNKENKPLTPTTPLLDEKKEDIKPIVPTITNVNKENKKTNDLSKDKKVTTEEKKDGPSIPTIKGGIDSKLPKATTDKIENKDEVKKDGPSIPTIKGGIDSKLPKSATDKIENKDEVKKDGPSIPTIKGGIDSKLPKATTDKIENKDEVKKDGPSIPTIKGGIDSKLPKTESTTTKQENTVNDKKTIVPIIKNTVTKPTNNEIEKRVLPRLDEQDDDSEKKEKPKTVLTIPTGKNE